MNVTDDVTRALFRRGVSTFDHWYTICKMWKMSTRGVRLVVTA